MSSQGKQAHRSHDLCALSECDMKLKILNGKKRSRKKNHTKTETLQSDRITEWISIALNEMMLYLLNHMIKVPSTKITDEHLCDDLPKCVIIVFETQQNSPPLAQKCKTKNKIERFILAS